MKLFTFFLVLFSTDLALSTPIINRIIGTNFEYKFGNDDESQLMYVTDGTIPYLQFETTIKLPSFPNMEITAIKVTVKALSPPKVDFYGPSKTISIKYTIFQSTASSYKIEVRGQHVDGEQISYIYNGVIPGFKPIYQLLNVTTQKEDLKPEFTYLRVEYYNLMSDVKVTYDPETFTLDFHIKYPFVHTLLGIMGHSLPV